MNRAKGILLILVCLILQPGIFAQQTTASQDINQQLLEAAGKGDKAAVESLLSQGADKNAKDKEGKSALVVAACNASNQVVRILLKAGADVNAADRIGRTALIAAASEFDCKIGEIGKLFRAPEANVKDKMQADSNRPPTVNDGARTEAVRALLAAHADVNAKDDRGVTALMSAADGGLRDAVDAFLAAGADPNAQAGNFETEKYLFYRRADKVIWGFTPVKMKGWTALKAAKDGG
jgi:uncharacterized protein